MLSLVQKQLLGFLSSRSISKMRPAKYIFSVWSALVTALLHQHSVPKAIQEGQLLITLPLSAHETLLRLSTLYPVTLVALWCHLSHPAAPLQYPMPSPLWYNLCEHTSLTPKAQDPEDTLQRWSYPDDQRHPAHHKCAWHHLLYFMIRLEY